jgi:hypothetical protein
MFRNVMIAAVAVLALYGIGNAADFTLTGDYLNIGVNNSGGLIDSGTFIGIQYDKTGSGNFSASPDFITPGTPLEFYSIGINGVTQGSAGYYNGNTFGATTFNTGSGSLQSTSTFALVNGNAIMTQTLYFDKASQSLHFSVDFINNTAAPMTVAYARGLDPDQDVYGFGSFATNNSIGTNGAGNAVATAVGPLSGLTIQIESLTAGGVASVTGWQEDPYLLLLGGNVGNGDNTIAMAWNVTVPSFKSTEIDFQYNLSAVPLPPALLLFAPGLLGLIGIRKRLGA